MNMNMNLTLRLLPKHGVVLRHRCPVRTNHSSSGTKHLRRRTAAQEWVDLIFSPSARARAAEILARSLPIDSPELKDLIRTVSGRSTAGGSASIGERAAIADAEETARKMKDGRLRHNREEAAEVVARALRRAEKAAAARIGVERISRTKAPAEKASVPDLLGAERTPGPSPAGKSVVPAPHPILGPHLVDMRPRRIHVVPAGVLAAVPVWNRQRAYRHDRAKSMAKEKIKYIPAAGSVRLAQGVGLSGIITLYEEKNGKLVILDGQHRVGMMAILQSWIEDGTVTPESLRSTGIDLDRVLVEVFSQNQSDKESGDEELAAKIFTEINRAEPVQLIDLPGAGISPEDFDVISSVSVRLARLYPRMFSPSLRCRPPHLNIDKLREMIFEGDVLRRHGLKDSEGLVDWIQERNEEVKNQVEKEGAEVKGNKAALEKARKFGLYLGLDSAWVHK